MDTLRQKLEVALAAGTAADPLKHAEQVARIAAVLHEAFSSAGLRCTVVGGSAIEIHAPGVYKSGDIDVVIDAARGADLDSRIKEVFGRLGFARKGRHWVQGDLFVEVPSHNLADPSQLVRVGDAVFRVVTKEVVLADRVVGFKHWRETAYGEQAIDMLAAFGDELEMVWLEPKLRREGAWDAFLALRDLAANREPVTAESLRAVVERLHANHDEA